MVPVDAWPSEESIAEFDAGGYVALDAISHASELAEEVNIDSMTHPHPFVVTGGGKYWVKAQGQHGLCSELVGGRLAKTTGTGPEAVIVRVEEPALPEDGSANHLLGVGVGFAHENSMENSKKLTPLVQANKFTLEMVNVGTYANVQVFYSWIGHASDVQVLVNFQNGAMRGIDYGDCFGNLANNADPNLVAIVLPGLSVQITPTPAQYQEAVERVKAITDDELLIAVCNMPDMDHWKSDLNHRRELASWLRSRRDRIHCILTT